MVRPPSPAVTTALSWWYLGACLTAADFIVTSDIDQYLKLADDNKGFPTQTFRSSPIVAPVFHVNSWDKDLTDDLPYIFIGANYGDVGGGAGPMILDASDLSLVYADQGWANSYYSEPQTIHGKPHLTFWANSHDSGGPCVVVDQNYNIKYNVAAVSPHKNDMHELHITDDGTAVFTTHRTISFDCSRWGGSKDCKVHDTGFQEVDLETNEVIFSWFAADHFDPDDTFARFEADDFGLNDKREGSFDLSHMNSARKTSDGNYLISSRHFFTIQLIDGKTGDPIWTLGGKKNQFKDLSDGMATNIGWQHNARFYHNQSHLTLFDNHIENQGDCGNNCSSRGLHLEIDTDAMTARVVREYYHPGHIDSLAMGGMHLLDSGNAITGWGWTPSFVEYTSDGRVAMDIQRGRVGVGRKNNMFAYRVFKGEWTGRPTSWPPSLAVDNTTEEGGNVTLYMSWNGATDISQWAILSSDDHLKMNQLDHLTVVPRTGFETSASVDPDHLSRYIAVGAVEKNGHMLGISKIFDTVTEEDLDDESGNITKSYTRAGSVFAGLIVCAAVVYGALYFYRHRRARPRDKGVRYSPILAQD